MANYAPYKVHPIADQFPLLGGDEFKAMVADIAERGLQQSITLLADEETIADGRNRYLACTEARVEPTFDVLPKTFTEEQIIYFIVSANLRRRHLNAGQRAVIALPIKEALAKEAEDRKKAGKAPDLRENSPEGAEPRPREQAGEIMGVSDNSVQRALFIQTHAPDLLEEIKTDELSLNEGYKRAKEQKEAAEQNQPEAEKPPKPTPEFVTLYTHTGDKVNYPKPKTVKFNPTNQHISWATWSWNPVTGCLHGCPYCYARAIANSDGKTFPVGFTPLFHHERLAAPATTKVPDDVASDPRRGRVFVCSMADLYGRWVPKNWIEQVHQVCKENPQWEYLMLTKFPERYNELDLPPSAWLGTSVDEQKRVRIAENAFRKIDNVRVKWLSLEPLKEELHFSDLSMFDWIVIGSQTATNQPDGAVPEFAPPFEWVARLVAQAREAGCAVYLKPNLLGLTNSQAPGMQLPQEEPKGRNARIIGESRLRIVG